MTEIEIFFVLTVILLIFTGIYFSFKTLKNSRSQRRLISNEESKLKKLQKEREIKEKENNLNLSS